MSNNICLEYNNQKYIKIDNSFKNRKVFNDKLLIITKGEFDTIKSILTESGEQMLPYLVCLTDKTLKFINDDHTTNHFGLYINENEYNSFFEKSIHMFLLMIAIIKMKFMFQFLF